MSCGSRVVLRVVVLAVLLAFHFAATCPAGAESAEGKRKAAMSPNEKSIRLSLKISRAKQRAREHAFYKSVARQRKVRPVIDRSPPSGR